MTKIKSNEVICYPTDKPGRFSIDSPTNCIESMKPHLQGMKEVTQIDYDNTEILLNAHMSAWCTIMKGDERTTNNFQSTNNTQNNSLICECAKFLSITSATYNYLYFTLICIFVL